MPWLLNEDAAVLAKLSGVHVTTPVGPLEVPVRWVTPEPERGEMTFPVIVLSQGKASRATDRESRGFCKFGYLQEGRPMPGPTDIWGYYGDQPIPFNVDYQVTVMCRLQEHQVELAGLLAKGDFLPERGGYLMIPEMGAVVSLDVIGGPERANSLDRHGKRLLTINYVIRVYTEMSPYDPPRYEGVETVSGRISDFDYQSEREGRLLSEWQDPASDV
jgi:hypothetical protein